MAQCELCGGSGFHVRTDEQGVARSTRCSCADSERTEHLQRSARIPRRYDHCELDTFEEFNETLREARGLAVEWLEKWPRVESGLLFQGPPGTGKTHLAVAIAKALVRDKGARVLFYEQRDLLKTLQGTFDENASRRESEVLGPIQNVEVLVLDDLGAGRITPWTRDVMHDIIAYRYNNRLPLIMTSNHAPGEDAPASAGDGPPAALTLNDRLGPALMSRLYEMCRIVSVRGDDYRKGVLHARHRF